MKGYNKPTQIISSLWPGFYGDDPFAGLYGDDPFATVRLPQSVFLANHLASNDN